MCVNHSILALSVKLRSINCQSAQQEVPEFLLTGRDQIHSHSRTCHGTVDWKTGKEMKGGEYRTQQLRFNKHIIEF